MGKLWKAYSDWCGKHTKELFAASLVIIVWGATTAPWDDILAIRIFSKGFLDFSILQRLLAVASLLFTASAIVGETNLMDRLSIAERIGSVKLSLTKPATNSVSLNRRLQIAPYCWNVVKVS